MLVKKILKAMLVALHSTKSQRVPVALVRESDGTPLPVAKSPLP